MGGIMRGSTRLFSVLLTLVCVLLTTGALLVFRPGLANALYGGVANPSFETPAANSTWADSWTIVSQPVTGNVARLQRDDASTFPVFATMGSSVAPRLGNWMLRFGIPKGTDSHQVKGLTKVTQTFTSDGTDIGLAYRVFTWEHKDVDVLVIDIKGPDGRSVGRLADKEAQSITATKVVLGTGTLPYTLDLNVEPRQLKYKDTGWQDVRITDLGSTLGKQLTISFTLDTNTTAAHDSWVYIDLADIVKPTVSITSPSGTTSDSTPTLVYAAADDTWGSGLDPTKTVVKVDGVAVTPAPDGSLPQQSDGDHSVSVTVTDRAGNVSATATSAFTVVTDTIDPVTTATLSGTEGNNGWYKSDVQVSLSAYDEGGSGLAGTFYAIDVGPPIPYGPLFFVLSDGIHTVSYWSTDVAGNEEAAKTVVIRIDTTPPAIDVAVRPLMDAPTDPPAGYLPTTAYNYPAIDFSAQDTGSGLVSDAQGELDGQQVTPTTPGPLSFELAEGTHTLTVTAVDKAGNETVVPYDFAVDLPAHPFTVQPGAADAHEGCSFGLYADDTAATGNTDGNWESKTWQWQVTTDGLEPFLFEGPVRFVTLPNATAYQVMLAVTDTGTTAAPGSGAMCVTEQTIEPKPQQPWVTALDIEVLDGHRASLVGRFLDPGWEQTHTASWTLEDVAAPVVASEEDNLPAMDSGHVLGYTEALSRVHGGDGEYDGQLTVTDSTSPDNQTNSVDFTVTAIEPDPQRDEGLPGNNTITTPEASSPEVYGGQVHLSYIQSEGDIDIFEIRAPGGGELPYGAEVLVTLRDLPADYDVALIQDMGVASSPVASLEGSSFLSSAVRSWQSAPTIRPRGNWEDSPTIRPRGDWVDSPTIRPRGDWVDSPTIRPRGDWVDSPTIRPRGGWLESPTIRPRGPLAPSQYIDAPTIRPRGDLLQNVPIIKPRGDVENPFVRTPLVSWFFTLASESRDSLDGWSFADMGFTGLCDNTASGSVLDFSALGFDNQDTSDMRVADHAAHVGTEPEVVFATKSFSGGHTYVAIKGANGAFSETQPYALQVETSLPLDVIDYVNEGTGTPRRSWAEDDRTTTSATPTLCRILYPSRSRSS